MNFTVVSEFSDDGNCTNSSGDNGRMATEPTCMDNPIGLIKVEVKFDQDCDVEKLEHSKYKEYEFCELKQEALGWKAKMPELELHAQIKSEKIINFPTIRATKLKKKVMQIKLFLYVTSVIYRFSLNLP